MISTTPASAVPRVVTSTITGLAADSVFGARVDKHPWRRRAGAIALIGAGAAVGALALNVHIGLGMALSAVITIRRHRDRPSRTSARLRPWPT